MSLGHAFMQSLRRMTVEERRLVATVFMEGCKEELPDNVHVSLDLIRRDLGITPAETLAMLRGMRSIGINVNVRDSEVGDPGDEMIVIEWSDNLVHDAHSVEEEWSFERSTEIACRMIELSNNYCADCARSRIDVLDFSPLSSATA